MPGGAKSFHPFSNGENSRLVAWSEENSHLIFWLLMASSLICCERLPSPAARHDWCRIGMQERDAVVPNLHHALKTRGGQNGFPLLMQPAARRDSACIQYISG